MLIFCFWENSEKKLNFFLFFGKIQNWSVTFSLYWEISEWKRNLEGALNTEIEGAFSSYYKPVKYFWYPRRLLSSHLISLYNLFWNSAKKGIDFTQGQRNQLHNKHVWNLWKLLCKYLHILRNPVVPRKATRKQWINLDTEQLFFFI